jgi:S-DNA-T family DNA segregation ATPase FtsK/SpoIIIE
VSRRKKRKKFKKPYGREKRSGRFALPEETKQGVWGILLILAAIIIGLSFFEKAGVAGQFFIRGSRSLIGETIFIIPLILILGGLVFLATKYDFKEKRPFWPVVLAIIILIFGITGILGSFSPFLRRGGWLGYVLSWPFLKYFGFWATVIIFLAPIIIGVLIFWQFLRGPQKKESLGPTPPRVEALPKRSLIKKIFAPRFKVKEVPSSLQQKEVKEFEREPSPLKLETKSITGAKISSYQPPVLDLLEKERGAPTSGDTRVNSAIIKKTLQNFGIEVAMSEINIGPTVTQYTLKPAEGIKLSKITALSNDLALALASHPIRIEAPIPGRSLVGIEVPNKVRAQVRLRNLIENPNFQRPTSHLTIALGKDVAGFPIYTDLTRMPHLLVAGSTGTGKTIFLNSLILSLLYQPSAPVKSASPESLRFILIDPKRVEFSVYKNLPHLLCPVIYSATQTINVLKWLTGEMERRFDVLSEAKARDIGKFNEVALNNNKEPLPFIILIIDELADLMAAKGREVEAGIVRLAQMARAVGIHLVVATQRPSVEVITGLIKANITSRITFQVASQVDSRTVLDSAGAEKLLGLGDMLYISAQVPKPKRIQGPYISEKEVKKVVNCVKSKSENLEFKAEMDSQLLQEMEKGSEESESGFETFYGGEDPLYEEAKRVVIEARRASASLLQRRLRIGYARAARLVDMLEDKGVVGPGEGAKPREVYGEIEQHEEGEINSSKREDEWEKV